MGNPHSPHNSTNRSAPCGSGAGSSGNNAGTSPPGLPRPPPPPPPPPPDLSSVLAAAAVANTTDPLVTFAATLASLGRFGRGPPGAAEQPTPHQLPRSNEEKSRALYCRGCQRFYSNSIFSFHVGISRHLSKLVADDSADIRHLAEAAKRLGLVVTAPLITDAGFVYVPVHPDCGGGGDGGNNGGVSGNESGGRAPLDLRTAKSITAEEAVEKEVGPVPPNATNSLLATIISGLVSGGLVPHGGGTTPAPPPPPPPPVPPPNWWFGGKMPDAATLEAFLQAMTSGAQTHHLTQSITEAARNSTEGASVEVQRPYLCTNCQTRFQAYSTFKVSLVFTKTKHPYDLASWLEGEACSVCVCVCV